MISQMFAANSKRRKGAQVAVGHRFRKRDAPRIVWEVESVFEGVDGVAYVAIFRADDPSMRKTVALAALEKGQQYERLPR